MNGSKPNRPSDPCAGTEDGYTKQPVDGVVEVVEITCHTSNLHTDHGQVVLLDFEAVAVGPREWDLMPTAVARERFRLSEERYREFADAYCFDVRTWPGYPVLREIRELTMTTWLMQNVAESAAVAAEFALRVASLRERDTRRVWTAF